MRSNHAGLTWQKQKHRVVYFSAPLVGDRFQRRYRTTMQVSLARPGLIVVLKTVPKSLQTKLFFTQETNCATGNELHRA